MDTEQTTENDVVTDIKEEGGTDFETLTIPKKDYETMNQTLGSLKKEIKDLKKVQQSTETSKNEKKPDEFGLLEKGYLRMSGITSEDEVELARDTSKKWGMELDKLVDDDDFKIKLEKLRTAKANADATSNLKGGAGTSQAKNTPEYWVAKGIPPSTTDVPDRKTRAKIARAMMVDAKSGKQFYNE